MKKLKTSNKNWYVVEHCGYWNICDAPYYGSRDLLNEEDSPLAKNNAKIASQAPKLLDALLNVYESDIMDNGMTFISDETWNKIYEVLKDAGCKE